MNRTELELELLEERITPTPGLQTPDHIVIVMEENHSYDQIISNLAAPYINALASQGALFSNYFAIEHPSLPNYLDIFSGSDQGITTDGVDTPGLLGNTPNLASELLQAGFTFGAYVEDTGTQDTDHTPWDLFSNVPSSDIHDFSSFPQGNFSSLPTVSFVIPNKQDDMHDGTVQQGDTWLAQNLNAYAQWATQNNSLLVVVWDEDDSSGTNQVPAIVVGQNVVPGQYAQFENHFSLLATIENFYNLPGLGGATTATTMDQIFAPIGQPPQPPQPPNPVPPQPPNPVPSQPPQQNPPQQNNPISTQQTLQLQQEVQQELPVLEQLWLDGVELDLDIRGWQQTFHLPSVASLVVDIQSNLSQTGLLGLVAVLDGVNTANTTPNASTLNSSTLNTNLG